MTKKELAENFRKRFHSDPEFFFFCPGRVNLIGEHIDYNGGNVMPCAISMGTYLVVARNIDKMLRFECLNFPETAELHLQAPYSKTGREWFNYPLGAIHQLLEENHVISGLDMFFYGDLPIGAGLSSSASIEIVTMYALNKIFGLNISKISMARYGKKAENEFIGVNSGIMDQFAVAMGKKDHAILLDCDSLNYEYLPFQIGDHVLAIINSNKQRTLADSKYNERFAECGQALKILKQEMDVTDLCDINVTRFREHEHLLQDAILRKRVMHVVSENERVQQARSALLSGDLKRFGQLMYESHESLKELYEVSGTELDTIVEFSKIYPGCIGTRMTGAGFGGCAIALVKKDQFDDYSTKLRKHYKEKIGYDAEVFASGVGDGVREWGE